MEEKRKVIFKNTKVELQELHRQNWRGIKKKKQDKRRLQPRGNLNYDNACMAGPPYIQSNLS